MARTIKLDFDVSVTGAQQTASKFKDLNEAISDSSKGLKDFTSGIKNIDFSEILSGASDAAKGISSLSSSLRGATLLTNPYVAGVSAIAASLVGWAAAQYKVAEGSAKLAKELKNLQRELGVTDAQAVQLMRTTKALAEGFEQEAEKVGEAIMALVNSAGAAIEEAASAVEKWGVILSKANFDKFTDSLNEFSGGMRDVGFTVEQTAEVLGVLVNNSQDTGKFLGAMFEAFNRLRDPTETLNAELIRFGLGDVSSALKSGAITGKEAFDRVSKAIIRAQKEGKNISVIMAELGDAFSEMGSKSFEFYDQAVVGANKLSRAQRELLSASKELADAETLRALKGKENLDIMMEQEATTLRLKAAWQGFLRVIENSAPFKTVTGWINNLLDSVTNFLSEYTDEQDITEFIEESVENKAMYWSYVNSYVGNKKGEAAEKARAEADKKFAEYIRKRKLELAGGQNAANNVKKSARDTQSSLAAAIMVPEASALQEAEGRLKKHLVTVQGLIETASTEAKITKEEAALQSIQAEQKHFEEVVSLALKLQGTTAVIDGEAVRYKKLTTEELREIEVKREELRVKAHIAELEKEIAHQKHLLELFTLTEEGKLRVFLDINEKRRAVTDLQFKREEISLYAHRQQLYEINMDSISREIEAEINKHAEVLMRDTLTNEEREILNKEHANRMAELRRKQGEERVNYEKSIAERIIELDKQALEGMVALEDRKRRIGASGAGLFMGGIFDGAVKAINAVNGLTGELKALNDEIDKLKMEREDADRAGDSYTVGALDKVIRVKSEALAQIAKEAIATKIITGLDMVKEAAAALFDAIKGKMQDEIDMLDRQLEKRKEILATMQEQFNTEEARLKTMLEIDAIRSEDRMRELEDLEKNIPEAQRVALEQEKEKERERSEMRANAIKLNLAQEKQRLREIEGSVKTLENKKLEVQERQFDIEKRARISQTIMDGLMAIVSLWTKPGFPAAIPLAAFVGALTGTTVAQIASQKNPYMQRFSKGTLNVTGGEYGKDSVPALLMPGESVIPVETNNLYKDTIRAIYTRKIPHKVLNKIVNDYINNSNSGTVFAVQNNNADIVEAIKNKPVSIVKFDEEGFKEYIVKTNDDYNILRKKLGL